MGFGLLFIAFSMLLIPFGIEIDKALGLGFDILPDLLAYLLIFRGLKNLKPYSKGFVQARLLTIPLMGLSAVTLLSQGIALLGTKVAAVAKYRSILAEVGNVVDTVSIPFLFFMLFYLCNGIQELAGEVELPKIVMRAKIASLLSGTFLMGKRKLYYFSAEFLMGKLLIGILPLPNIIHWLVGILTYIVYFTYLYLLFSCYMHIVYADEDPKPMFNPLFNLLDKSNKKDSDSKK